MGNQKKNKMASLEEKWSKCVDCKYNKHNKKNKLKVGDFQLFNCYANIDEFPCDRIPELYPHKLLEGLDGRIMDVDSDFELFPYALEMYDTINDNITRVIVAASSKEAIEERFKKIVQNKIYRHLILYKVNKVQDLLKDLFPNHTIMILPNEVNRVVFPELDIEMDHYGKSIKVKELTYDLKRYPGIDENNCKPSHINVNERLSVGYDNGKDDKQGENSQLRKNI